MGNSQSVVARTVASAVEKSLPVSDNYFLQKVNRWAAENSRCSPTIEIIDDSDNDDDVKVVAVERPSPVLTPSSSSSSTELSFTSPPRRAKIRSKPRDRSFMSPYYRNSRKSLTKDSYFEMLCRNIPNYRSNKIIFKKIHPKRAASENFETKTSNGPISKYNYLDYTTNNHNGVRCNEQTEVEIVNDSNKFVHTSSNEQWFESFRKELIALDEERAKETTAQQKAFDQILKKRSALIRVAPSEIEVDPQTPPLSDAMKKEIQDAFRCPAHTVLVSAFKLDITRADLDTLKGLTWLNDSVINFYLNMVAARSQSQELKLPRVYAFNTFFFTRLSQDGHKGVRRWTRRDDIFGYDIIVVPIHLGMHWCLAVIDFRKKLISYYDSMGGDNDRCTSCLLQYLQDEREDKKKEILDINGWNCKNLKDLPQQGNGSDCGMFACKYAEYVSRDARINFTQKDMPYFRQRMIYEILKGKLL